ncbi:MAG TPA: tetratricopeptide repeat protein [Gemmatimonadaceae bacterium]|nr:tetratricopeptide repeat protein [Gemmatimonadaceae bacterium]
MSNIAKLKKEAAEFEQKRQFDKALAKYQQIVQRIDEDPDEADVALFNRVGDLLLRQGSVADAVGYYERAVDLYAESGFFNNAIALCNKILRNAPGRSVIYYKLGRISAKKGFVSDAKQSFLEYADRMRKAGQLDEAFRALKEFADLCPDQDDIRVMLADQLVRDGRKAEAIEQLQLLYEKLQEEGRESEARATVTRMKGIDPAVEPREGAGGERRKPSDLVFLDPHDDGAWNGRGAPTPAAGSAVIGAGRRTPLASTPISDLPLIDPDEPLAAAPIPGIEHGSSLAPEVELPAPDAMEPLAGLEPGSFGQTADAPPPSEIEPATIADAPVPDEPASAALENTFELPVAEAADLSPADAPQELLRTSFDAAPLADLPVADEMLDAGLDAAMHAPAEQARDASPLFDELALINPDEGVGGQLAADVESIFVEEPQSALSGLEVVDADLDATPPLLDPSPYALVDDAAFGAIDLAAPPAPEPPPPLGALAPEPEEAHDPVTALRAELERHPENRDARRRLGEALIERGDRAAGVRELETVMFAFERQGDYFTARSLADEIVRIDPDAVSFHQKRVEYAFRLSDRARLIEAYLELADSLVRGGELTKARSVYGRVYDLAPDDPRAQMAMDTMRELTGEHLRQATPPDARASAAPAASPPAAPPPVPMPPAARAPDSRGAAEDARRASAAAAPRPAPPPAAPKAAPASAEPRAQASDADGFVDLGAWLREDEPPKSTRMIAEGVSDPEDGEDVGFQEMLERFKQGVAANVEENDYQAHYDLGIAYREMGLLDEAIAEFQKALRASGDRVRSYEALGQCFVDKKQYQIARALLGRALADQSQSDDTLIGVLYLLGASCEALRHWDEARGYYERVFAVDIQFRDVQARLAAVEAEGARA